MLYPKCTEKLTNQLTRINTVRNKALLKTKWVKNNTGNAYVKKIDNSQKSNPH